MEHAIETNQDKASRKPSTAFLVALNALLFLVLLLPGQNPIGWILAIPATVLFMIGSGVWQVIWRFLDRRFRFHNAVRCLGFVLPVAVLVVLPYLGIKPSRPINRQTPALSVTGEHKAYVRAKPDGWTVEIQDQNGKALHEEQTDFVPHLSVYWIWGPNEQLWLYNSDDGSVNCWHPKANGEWQYLRWGYGQTQETDVNLGTPPEDLYPDYAKHPKNATEQSDEPALK